MQFRLHRPTKRNAAGALESIEFSFRDIEAIRTQFHDALTLIDQTLVEIERTKVAHLEAERKLENLTSANDRLQRDRAGLTVERDALAVAQDELLARASDLEQTVTRVKRRRRRRLRCWRNVAPNSSKRNGTLTTIGVHCTR